MPGGGARCSVAENASHAVDLARTEKFAGVNGTGSSKQAGKQSQPIQYRPPSPVSVCCTRLLAQAVLSAPPWHPNHPPAACYLNDWSHSAEIVTKTSRSSSPSPASFFGRRILVLPFAVALTSLPGPYPNETLNAGLHRDDISMTSG